MARARPAPSKETAAVIAAAGAAAVGGKLAWDKLSGNGDDDPRAYRLHDGEFVPDGVRRIARGQLDNAIEWLDGAAHGQQLGDAVHETRKGLKRLRTSLRVARPAIGDETYRRENAAFRNTGRRLSGARDARVLIETLDALTSRFGGEISPGTTARLRAELEQDHDRAEAALRDGPEVAAALEELKLARERTAGWTFEEHGFDALGPGVRRLYRRGRRSMRAAAKEPGGDERLHEWRKRVKDLWHASQLLRMKRFAKRAHRLSDRLGDDHDLAVLREYVNAHPHYFEDDAQRLALSAAIDRRREQLQQDAFQLGAKVYEQPPKKFVRSIERRWRKRAPEQLEPVAA
jgi:hypothetical protein